MTLTAQLNHFIESHRIQVLRLPKCFRLCMTIRRGAVMSELGRTEPLILPNH